VYQSGYNLQKVRFFLKVVAELMEAVLFLPEENQDDKFLQGVLSNIVHFFKLDGLHFENERNRYARIITTSELLFENLKMDVLHL
jgi:hypothetical protein